MFSPFSKISLSVADTLSFSSDNLFSTFVDAALIAAFALAVFGPTPKSSQVHEETFVQQSSFSAHEPYLQLDLPKP